MNTSKLSIDTVHTTHGLQYNIVDRDGTIYATTYDKLAADICYNALRKLYPAGN